MLEAHLSKKKETTNKDNNDSKEASKAEMTER